MAQPAQESITGVVSRILFPKKVSEYETTDFRIFAIDAGADSCSVKGSAQNLRKGATVKCEGVWENHPLHGRTFKAALITEQMPADLSGIKEYLSKAKIAGMGPKTAERIVDRFGESVFDVLDNEPERLLEIKAIKKKTHERIIKGWQERRATHTLMLFLQKNGVPPAMSHRVYKHMGGEGISPESIIDRLTENPYLIADVHGIGFKTADGMAQSLGIEKESLFRIAAGTVQTMRDQANAGHTMCTWNDAVRLSTHLLFPECAPARGDGGYIREEKEQLFDTKKPVVEQGLRQQMPANKVLEIVMDNGVEHITLAPLRRAEDRIASNLIRIKTFGTPLTQSGSSMLKGPFVINNGTITLDDSQADAVRTACTNPITIITGRPGTGKTATMRAIIDIADRLGRRIACCAPTGLAAVRLSEATGMDATTIHRLLKIGYEGRPEGGFTLDVDFMIIDETSMIGTHLMADLLEALPAGCAVVFVGDVDQLPSVEPGNVLGDMIASGAFPTKRLTKIHRQQTVGSRGLGIVDGAHAIIEGHMPTFNKNDFQFIAQEDDDTAARWIPEIMKRMHARGTAYANIQVLSPMRKGSLGVDNLNTLIQAALNPADPSKSEIPFRGMIFREGDRVRQTKNDYELGVVNGDVGYILSIDTEEDLISIGFTGERVVEIDRNQLENVTLNYCGTIHSSQGSEYERVILPATMAHYVMLNQNLLYTGATRAKHQCVTIGTTRAIGQAVRTKSNSVRCTGLKRAITAAEQRLAA